LDWKHPNSRALAMIKQTFSGKIDKSGEFSTSSLDIATSPKKIKTKLGGTKLADLPRQTQSSRNVPAPLIKINRVAR
jgi:hypothetical protein